MPSLSACVHWTLNVHFSWPLLTERLLAPHWYLSLFPDPETQCLAYNKTYNRNTVIAKRDQKRLSASYQRTIRFEKTSLETIQFTNVPILSPFCLIPGRAERSHVSCRLGEDQTYSRLCCAWKLRAFWMSLMMLLIDGMFDEYVTWYIKDGGFMVFLGPQTSILMGNFFEFVCACVSYEPTSGLQEMCSSILEDVTYYWKFEILCVWISVQTEKSQGCMDNAWNCKIQSFFPAIIGYATPNTIDKWNEIKD